MQQSVLKLGQTPALSAPSGLDCSVSDSTLAGYYSSKNRAAPRLAIHVSVTYVSVTYVSILHAVILTYRLAEAL